MRNLEQLGNLSLYNWAEGVVFTHVPMEPVTDELVEDFLKGRVYYVAVNFALMDKYEPVVTYKDLQAQVPIPLINVSSSRMLSELAKWLKTQS